MDITLWIFQGVLAFAFLMAGVMKLTSSKDKLREKVGGWVDSFSAGAIKTIGFVELLGAVGLVVPMLADIQPILTPIAATGLAATMVGAMGVHLKRKETKESGINALIMALAIFVAVGRFVLVPVI